MARNKAWALGVISGCKLTSRVARSETGSSRGGGAQFLSTTIVLGVSLLFPSFSSFLFPDMALPSEWGLYRGFFPLPFFFFSLVPVPYSSARVPLISEVDNGVAFSPWMGVEKRLNYRYASFSS